MEDLILAEGYGRVTGTVMSSNWKTDCVYLHFEFSDDSLFRNYRNKYLDVVIDFWQLLYYGLDHEEIHLVLHKIGEDINCIDNLFISKVMAAYWFGYNHIHQRKLFHRGI